MNNTYKLPIGAKILHFLAFLPIVIVYFFFELFKAIFTELHRAVIPVFVLIFLGTNWIIPKVSGTPNLLFLGTIFKRDEWLAFMNEFYGEGMTNTGFENVLLSLIIIILLVALYTLPALFMALFVDYTVKDMNDRFEWDSKENFFYNMFQQLKLNSAQSLASDPKKFYLNRGVRAIINIVFAIGLVVLWNLFIGTVAG